MARVLDVATQEAVRNRSAVAPRNFITIWAPPIGGGSVQTFGLWDDADTVTLNVIDPDTGGQVSRAFTGDGVVQAIDPIPMTIGIEVANIQIVLSQVHPAAQLLARGHELRNAPVQVHRGWLNPVGLTLAAAPRPRFLGQVNEVDIATPAVGGEGAITLNCVSHTRELTRTNPARRSDETQRLRSGDRFRRYAGTAGLWPVWWGEDREEGSRASSRRPANPKKRD